MINKHSTCPCNVGKKAGSEVPRWIFYGFHRFSTILMDLYGFHGFLGPGLERRGWGPTNKQSTCPCKVGKKAGSEVPRLMTGSAGTAMDVLATCFSKKGGGSGRRGCKYRAQVVRLETFTDDSNLVFFSRFSFSSSVSKP